MTDPKRERSLRKTVSFSPAEWSRIARRMEVAGSRSFESFAREALLEARVKVVRLPFDPMSVRYELSRLGNNLNQIARQVNVQHETSTEEMREARKIMREVQEVLDAEMKRAGR